MQQEDSSMDVVCSLDGEWRLVCDDGREFAAAVPGDVHLDLMRAGVIADPGIRMNYLDCRWIGEHTWSYHRSFSVSGIAGRKYALVFDGLAYVAEIYVNGRLAGRHKTMHRPCRLEVTGLLHEGENSLEVRLAPFDPAEKEVPLVTCPVVGWADAIGDPELCAKRGGGRKAEYTYGWDWTQGLPVCGIWRGCRLECNDFVRISEPQIRAAADGAVTCVFQLESVLDEIADGTGTLIVRRGGSVVAEVCQPLVLGPGVWHCSLDTAVKSPELWYPRGYGEQPLYEAELKIVSRGHEAVKTLRFAFRTVEVEQRVVSERQEVFRLHVNGRKIFAKGCNWIPADILPGRVTAERLRHLLELAAAAGMNYLRIWGGGCYEQDLFYNLCDELGIMVWHDFMFSGSEIADFIPSFHQECLLECETVLKRLRHHPCIVMWCGSNETDGFYESACPRKRPEHYCGWRLFHIDFPELVARFSPGTPYLPSCPSSGLLRQNPNSPGHGTYHGNFLNHQYASDAEFDAEPSIPAFDNELYGVSGDPEGDWSRYLDPGRDLNSWDNEVFQAHHVLELQRNNEWKLFFENLTFDTWGRRFELPVPQLLGFFNAAHCELVKRYMEVFLRNLDIAGGAVFWMYNNAFPMMGWAMVDYYGTPKDVWYAMKRVCNPRQPVIAVYDDSIDFYLANTSGRKAEGCLSGQIRRFDGTVLAEAAGVCTAEAGESPRLLSLNRREVTGLIPEECWVYAVWEDMDGTVTRSHRCLTSPRTRRIPNTDVTVRRHPVKAQTWILESPRFASNVTLAPREADNFPDDCCFDLYPGVPHEVSFRHPVERPELCWENCPDRQPYVCGLEQDNQKWQVVVYNPLAEPVCVPVSVRAVSCAVQVPETLEVAPETAVAFPAVIQPDVFQDYPFCLPVDLAIGGERIRTACAAMQPDCMDCGVLTLVNSADTALHYPCVEYSGMRTDGTVYRKSFADVAVKPDSEQVLDFSPPADLLPYSARIADGDGHSFPFWENAVPFERIRELMKLDGGAELAIDVLPFAGEEPEPVIEGAGRLFQAGVNGVSRLIPERGMDGRAELFLFHRGRMLYVDVFTEGIPFRQNSVGNNVWTGTCVELLLGYAGNSVYRDYSLALTPNGPEVFLRRGTPGGEPGLRGDSCRLQVIGSPAEKLMLYRLRLDTVREGMPELLSGDDFRIGMVLRGLDCDGLRIFNGIGYMEGCVNAAVATIRR